MEGDANDGHGDRRKATWPLGFLEPVIVGWSIALGVPSPRHPESYSAPISGNHARDMLSAPRRSKRRACHPDRIANGHEQRVIRAIHRLRERFAEPVRIEELAAVAKMSPSVFHRQFKALTSTSPLQYQKTTAASRSTATQGLFRGSKGRPVAAGSEASSSWSALCFDR